MLGVVFTLMMVLIVLQPSTHHSLAIDGYRSFHAVPMPQALREDAMKLMLTRDGSIYFRNVRAANMDLPDLIRQCVQSGSPRKVFFVVDARAKYGDVSVALDGVRRAGVWEIAFLGEASLIHK